jgi:hypothetical protein
MSWSVVCFAPAMLFVEAAAVMPGVFPVAASIGAY